MRHIILFSLCFILSGCSTISFNTLFNDYATQVSPSRHAIANDEIINAQSLLEKNSPSHSNFLLNQLERGRLADLANTPEQAQLYYENVYQQMQQKHLNAKIQLSAGLEQSNALLTNDSAITYTPAPYEMSMLHSYKALNFIYKHDIDSALVEVRRANKVQVDALADNQHHIDAAQDNYQQHYPEMDNLLRSVKNGFQNAYTFYLSALLYETAQQFDDAYIDYKKAFEIQPTNKYLQNDLLRLAKQQGFEQDYHDYTQRFNRTAPLHNTQGQVIVFFEQGLVPQQHELTLRLPIYTSDGDERFYSLSMPVYKNTAFKPSINAININNQHLTLSPLVHLESLAAKTLQQKIPGKIARQALRLVAKEKMRQELARSAGDVGNIVANIYNLASEQADTRSWLTLPNQISVVRYPLDEGQHVLTANTLTPITFTVSKQRLTLIYITSVNNYLNYHEVQL